MPQHSLQGPLASQVPLRHGNDFLFFLFFLFLFCLFRAAPATYGGSQARGPIRAIAAGLHHSHSHVGSELCL